MKDNLESPMKKHHGKSIPIHWTRTFISDLVYYSSKIPLCTIEKNILLPELENLRQGREVRIGWASIFTKAMGIASIQFPELRRAWIPFPYAHIYEHPIPIGSIAVQRNIEGHESVLFGMVQEPNNTDLGEITQSLTDFKNAPLDDLKLFKRIRRNSKLPWPIRSIIWNYGLHFSGYCKAKNLGTFGISSVAKYQANTMNLLSPLTSALNYSTIQNNNECLIRMTFDHRILDGGTVAQILGFLEETINQPIRNEILESSLFIPAEKKKGRAKKLRL